MPYRHAGDQQLPMRRLTYVLRIALMVPVCASAETKTSATTATPRISATSQECLDCHEGLNPGLVADWRTSLHSRTTPRLAYEKPAQQRRMSTDSVPEDLNAVVVGCFECHGLRPKKHKDSFEHFGHAINVIVSPEDCRTCHKTEARQYDASKKAHALDNLRKNPLYHSLVQTLTGNTVLDTRGSPVARQPSMSTKANSCYACHGTEVTVNGMRTITSDVGDVEVPRLINWPNQGVGRINPDGSRGACTACHPRHSFSIVIARKPHTCGQCHLEPDVPAYNVFQESKHGNIESSVGDTWNWDHVPWRAGVDFSAPTCAACHNSHLVGSSGATIVERSHDFGARLWIRIFGLVYTHPQPANGATHGIVNADSLPLPVTLRGAPASTFLIANKQQDQRRSTMASVCKACHSSSWTDEHFSRIDSVCASTDSATATATAIVMRAWKSGFADKKNPFDEPIEHLWMRQWLFYANSTRYAAAMSGPDYAGFKNGWWNSAENTAEMLEVLDDVRKLEDSSSPSKARKRGVTAKNQKPRISANDSRE